MKKPFLDSCSYIERAPLKGRSPPKKYPYEPWMDCKLSLIISPQVIICGRMLLRTHVTLPDWLTAYSTWRNKNVNVTQPQPEPWSCSCPWKGRRRLTQRRDLLWRKIHLEIRLKIAVSCDADISSFAAPINIGLRLYFFLLLPYWHACLGGVEEYRAQLALEGAETSDKNGAELGNRVGQVVDQVDGGGTKLMTRIATKNCVAGFT